MQIYQYSFSLTATKIKYRQTIVYNKIILVIKLGGLYETEIFTNVIFGVLLSLNVFGRNVQAKYWKEYYFKPREVKVIKPVKIYKMKIAYPLYKTHAVASKILRKGQKVHIRDVASYEWLVTHKGWANGYFKAHGKYFWQCPKAKGWYKLVR